MVEEEEEDKHIVETTMIYRVDPELVSEVLQLGDLLLGWTHGGARVCLKYQGLESRECMSGRKCQSAGECQGMLPCCHRVPENAI